MGEEIRFLLNGAEARVSEAGPGDTLANLTGAGGAGVHHVSWNFQGAPRRTAATELSPSQHRDSILLAVRAPQVLDSLQRVGYDTAAISRVRSEVNMITSKDNAVVTGRIQRELVRV